jgi:hypothetical protein
MNGISRFVPLLALGLAMACAGDKVTAPSGVTGRITLNVQTGGVTLNIYADGRGTLLKTVVITEPGRMVVDLNEQASFYTPPRYFIYALKPGCFTGLILCRAGDSKSVALSPVVSGKFCGVLFLDHRPTADSLMANQEFIVSQPAADPLVFTTDGEGRFAVDLAEGDYEVSATTAQFEEYAGQLHVAGQYSDCHLIHSVIVRKPNIYICPTRSMRLQVGLTFPAGGLLTSSIPEYGDGWAVDVLPGGLIDGEYDYLFYEFRTPDLCQYSLGWVVPREELESFFRRNMKETGFRPREMDDFIEYWIPRLRDHPYYSIYPQYADEVARMVQLTVSASPDNLLRVFYVIAGLAHGDMELPAPVIPAARRDGFSVAEWGVILRH